MAKPRKAGCWRVEHKAGEWCWAITYWLTVYDGPHLYFHSQEILRSRDSKWGTVGGAVMDIARDLNFVEVEIPKGTK